MGKLSNSITSILFESIESKIDENDITKILNSKKQGVVNAINKLPNVFEYVFELQDSDNRFISDSITMYAILKNGTEDILPSTVIINQNMPESKEAYDKLDGIIKKWFLSCWSMSNKKEKKKRLGWHESNTIIKE